MRRGRWAYYFLGWLAAIALLADLLANDRPIVAGYADGVYFPAISSNDRVQVEAAGTPDWAIWPPIPFRASTTDLSQPGYRPPFASPPGGEPAHLLGTDRLGRDTLAGLINGTRVAVCVGVGSLLISLIVGLPLGAVAGFFGNGGLQLRLANLLACGLGATLGLLYALASLLPLVGFGPLFCLMVVLSVGIGVSLCYLVLWPLRKHFGWWQQPIGLPIDWFVLLLLELAVSIPGLVLLIAVLSFVDRPPLYLLVLVIGLLGWTPIARFLRAELLRIRELPYIAAARMGGVGELRLLIRHALPNALGPVAVVASFMVGTSILAEAMLSFLGIGVPSDQVTWGSLLQQSRLRPDAWWLAVFPGLLLTMTVLACNSIRQSR
ncbi:peptide/nickel transport system permease protein [Neolewinella xylanilytica]|uniref:Peptide/nickel transport system permease protein n=1 Tax=Neolewinella xylanilytica TaxID=1514080 RepID=A0A2S6I419_9BACT|nr:ABC transporter permease [Neolewinella xylanilytica]PPK85927.1 peptide/nickel transport system permease protein [Neolewinella xylanilytica]